MLVEGLDDGRFALIAKADAALVEGGDGFDPLAALLCGLARRTDRGRAPKRPEPTPGRVALLRAELARRAREVSRLEGVGETLGQGLRGALNALERAVASRSELPLTGPAGPHRRVDWLALDDGDVRRIGERLGATTQGVLLATLAGALRVFLARRGLEPAELDVRALTPIGVGHESSAVDAPLVALPLAAADPKRRLAALAREAPEPRAPEDGGFSLLDDARAPARGRRRPDGRRACACPTLSATPAQRFLLGAPLRDAVGFAPLLPGSHAGTLGDATRADASSLGFAADAALMADLPLLADAVAAAFDELRRTREPDRVHPARETRRSISRAQVRSRSMTRSEGDPGLPAREPGLDRRGSGLDHGGRGRVRLPVRRGARLAHGRGRRGEPAAARRRAHAAADRARRGAARSWSRCPWSSPRASAQTLGLLALAAASFVACGWTAQRREPPIERVPEPTLDLELAIKVGFDQLALATHDRHAPRLASSATSAAPAREVREAHALFERSGWLEKPESSYHETPPPLDDAARCAGAQLLGLLFEQLVVRERLRAAPRRAGPRALALLRATTARRTPGCCDTRDAARPWLVCIHGYGMGSPAVDLAAFEARRLHHELGLNLLCPGAAAARPAQARAAQRRRAS